MAEQEGGALFGLDDAQFAQKKPVQGLITRREVRAVSLARLELRPESTVWDIGTGSGAMAIEAARICRQGRVFSIEKNPETAALARQNLEKFGCKNLRLAEGVAPQDCRDWPAPDAVFVGGSGGQMAPLVEFVTGGLAPGGRLVLNLVTLENLHEALQALGKKQFEPDVTLVQISRSRDLLGLTRLEALNPIFVVAAVRKG